jgi:hypothetical protein
MVRLCRRCRSGTRLVRLSAIIERAERAEKCLILFENCGRGYNLKRTPDRFAIWSGDCG